ADDGRGGRTLQSYAITVTGAVTATASLYGTKYSDLNGNGVRDGTGTRPTTLGTINLTQYALSVRPRALAYQDTTNAILVAYSTGSTLELNLSANLLRILPNGAQVPYATVPGLRLQDGNTMAIARSNNLGGFTDCDIFLPNGNNILRVSNGGATINQQSAPTPPPPPP